MNRGDNGNITDVYVGNVLFKENAPAAPPVKPQTPTKPAPTKPTTPNPNPFTPQPGRREKTTPAPNPKNKINISDKLKQIIAKYIFKS